MIVRLRAGLPQSPWEGTAVLCFRRSAWFSDGSDALLGLFSKGIAPSPGGLTLEGDCPSVQAGTVLRCRDGRWVLEGHGELHGVAQAHEATETLASPGTASPEGPLWRQAWERWFRQTLPQDDEGRWLGGLLGGPGTDWHPLVGRGSGSTPLGDDYLAGWMAARMSRSLWSQADREGLRKALSGTTRLSRHYLSHLAEGRAEAALAEFVRTRPQPAVGAALSLAGRGDRSGLGTLVGLVAGLTTGV